MNPLPAFATRVAACAAFAATGVVACRHTEGAKPLRYHGTLGALGTAPITPSLVIDVGVSDVRLIMDEPQPVMVSNLGSRDLRDSVSYALETTPAECVKPDVSPGRIAEKHRAKHCDARWTIYTPRIGDVRARASVGDVELVVPADRAIRMHAEVGSVHVRLDGRLLQNGKSPGAGEQWQLGDLNTLPRLDVRTGVGSLRAELKTTGQARNER